MARPVRVQACYPPDKTNIYLIIDSTLVKYYENSKSSLGLFQGDSSTLWILSVFLIIPLSV
jgi:hypothetical protein